MKDPILAAIGQYFNDGYKEFVKEWRSRSFVSNQRLYRLLTAIKGPEFVEQVKQYKVTINARHAMLRVARKPGGFEVPNREFGTIWLQYGMRHGEKYAIIWIQVKPGRWIHFFV